MYSNNPATDPAGYRPYFYQWGLFVAYPLTGRKTVNPVSYHAPASYNFSSDRSAWTGSDRVQTVEQVIACGYFAVPQGDPVTALISDKRHTARFGLDDVISQIRTRFDLYHQNMYELSQAVCEANNTVFRQMADHGMTVANQRQQYSAAKQVQELYEQQRAERVNLWRDVSRLRLALPETAQQYLTAYRKVSALESYRGDAP